MASQKKQHYVPRFYLKNFSMTQGKSINIFNLRSKRNILDGNLKNQCYEDYFYGDEPSLEKALAGLEGLWSRVIATILNEEKLPVEYSEAHFLLVLFIVIQHKRTKFAANLNDDMVDRLAKNILQHDATISKEELQQVRIGLENPVLQPLGIAASLAPIIMDLKLHLIINSTTVSFITSDNPVVLHNQYCEGFSAGSSTGLASVGLQIFLPLSPRLMLLLYDGKIYKAGNRKDKATNLQNITDVVNLNKFQWLNALENIYYTNPAEAKLIESEGNKAKDIDKRTKVNLDEFQVPSDDDKIHSIIHIYKPDHKMRLKLSFVSIQKRRRSVPIEQRIRQLRDPQIIQLYEEFSELVKEHKYKAGEFIDFLRNEGK